MDDIHGLKPFMFFAPNFRLLALLAFAALAFWLAARWWRARRRPAAELEATPPPPVPAVTPTRSALRLIEELASRGHAAADRPRELHAALSAILRAYLGALLDLPARRLTTTELLALLAARGLEERAHRQVGELLMACDLAKFAGFRPSREEVEARLRSARTLVEALGDRPVPPDDEELAAVGSPPRVAGGPA